LREARLTGKLVVELEARLLMPERFYQVKQVKRKKPPGIELMS